MCKTPDDKTFQEPWAYEQHLRAGLVPQGKDGLYATVLPVARYMIGLRYRLLQVFYDAMFANLSTGLPICRVLSLVHPEDASLFAENLDVQNSEFMVGNDLLVAPVLAPEGQCGGRRDVYLPTGTDWYSFKDDRQPLSVAVPGGTTIRGFDAHLDVDENHLPFTVPLYVRAGAVVPVLGPEDYVGQRHHDGLDHPVTYSIYPGVEGSYTSYLDDGVSRSSAPTADPALDDDPLGRGEYRQVTITHRTSRDGSRRYVEVEREHDGYTPQEKYFVVQLLHDPAQRRDSVTGLPVHSVRCAGLDLPRLPGGSSQGGSRAGARALEASEVNAWYHDEQLNATYVKVFDDRPLQQLVAICAC
jgi:alpha-glucosidase